MKFHKQTILTGNPEGRPGNCVQTCVASLLSLELDQVPHFLEISETPQEWEFAFEDWLADRGFYIVRYGGNYIFEGLYLASGPTARNKNIYHMVIMRNDKLIHDPHPDNTGLTRVEHIWLLVPFEPQLKME